MANPPDDALPSGSRLPPRLKRTLELVYRVEGVTAARVWEWDDRVAVGVRPSASTTPQDLLRRVEVAVSPVRQIGETWEFGILEEDDESR